ncbi:MAG: hypothetical protein LBG14_06385 [Treponema sp.]|jgi:hypothetical protein|nr:hypothetical protein [Treponema sp.]
MKKLLVTFAILAAASGTLSAFDILSYPPPVKGGNILVDLGVGLGIGYRTHGRMSIPALAADVEYALPVNLPISVGGTVGFVQYKGDYTGTTITETWTYTFFGAKGNWHWGFDVQWLDLYSGLFFGYRHFAWDVEGYSSDLAPDYSDFSFGGQIGAHFYFTKNVGAVLEFGAPFSKIGLALKF